MNLQFEKATRAKAKARIALTGPSGSGKTWTALEAATALKNGGRVAVIDTERGSASLYSDRFDFDVLELDFFSPEMYIHAIDAAEGKGYDVIVIDSLSHAWEGEGGALDKQNSAAKRSGNSFTAWADVTPIHRRLIDTILQSKCHVIATLRSKMEYVIEQSNGKSSVRKVGMAPIQRPGTEYEFTIVADLDIDHNIAISKTRCALYDGKTGLKPDEKWFRPLREWLDTGVNGKTIQSVGKELGAVVSEQAEAFDHEAFEKLPENQVENVNLDWNAVKEINPEMPMSIEMATSEKTRDGVAYGEIETETLAHMANALVKAMKKQLPPEEREEKARKLDAIRTILKHRANESN